MLVTLQGEEHLDRLLGISGLPEHPSIDDDEGIAPDHDRVWSLLGDSHGFLTCHPLGEDPGRLIVQRSLIYLRTDDLELEPQHLEELSPTW